MKEFILLFLLLGSIPVLAQTKVAVYVVESPVDDGIKKIIGSEMVSAIVANKDYQAVERTPVFLEQLSKEQGVGDDQRISMIGKRIGVDNVCVIDVTSFQTSYYVQARLLEVNDAVVLSTAREVSPLSNIDDIVSITEQLASKLIGEDAVVNQVGKEYSIIGYMPSSAKNLHIISVDNSGSLVKLTFKYCTPAQTVIYIKPETHLYSENNNIQYRLVTTDGIAIAPGETTIFKGIYTFSLYFEKLPDGVKEIDLIEPEGWCIYDISLKPFGKRNYHEFIDNSRSDYESVCQQYEQNLRQYEQQQERQRMQQEQQLRQREEEQRRAREASENLVNSIENMLTYELKVVNTKLFPRWIWIGDRCIGKVKGNSEATFKVAITYYGSAKAVQSEGYVISPSTETFYIQKPYSGQMVFWIIK